MSQLQKLGVSQSAIIRQAITTEQINVTVQPVCNSDTLDEIAAQCGKIGSTINQIAHWLNGGNPREARRLKECRHGLADLSRIKQELEKLAGDA